MKGALKSAPRIRILGKTVRLLKDDVLARNLRVHLKDAYRGGRTCHHNGEFGPDANDNLSAGHMNRQISVD